MDHDKSEMVDFVCKYGRNHGGIFATTAELTSLTLSQNNVVNMMKRMCSGFQDEILEMKNSFEKIKVEESVSQKKK
jgi:hypothetical protein